MDLENCMKISDCVSKASSVARKKLRIRNVMSPSVKDGVTLENPMIEVLGLKP